MIRIALTGSIGMGKSTALSMFAELGAAIWSADDAVHRLYAKGGAAVAPVGAAFADAVIDGAIDRERLSALVLTDPQRLKKLEEIVHPLVGADRIAFIQRAAAEDAPAVICDVPLLFETGQESQFDIVVVVSAPADIQRERVLSRPGMTPEKFDAILAQQMPDAEKRRRAHYVVNTAQPLEKTREEIGRIYNEILRQYKDEA